MATQAEMPEMVDDALQRLQMVQGLLIRMAKASETRPHLGETIAAIAENLAQIMGSSVVVMSAAVDLLENTPPTDPALLASLRAMMQRGTPPEAG